jgi:hypothetical protein
MLYIQAVACNKDCILSVQLHSNYLRTFIQLFLNGEYSSTYSFSSSAGYPSLF